MSPSLRWLRMSPKLSSLFKNSIQAMPLMIEGKRANNQTDFPCVLKHQGRIHSTVSSARKLWIYLKLSALCRLQNVPSLAMASWICKDEDCEAAWFSIFSAVSKVGHGALRQYSTTYCSSYKHRWFIRCHAAQFKGLGIIICKCSIVTLTAIFVRLFLASSTSSDQTSCPQPPTDAESSCSSTKSSFTL